MRNEQAATDVTLAVVDTLYDCGKRGDLAGFFSLLSEDVVLHEPPFLPYGGVYAGHAGFTKAFGFVAEHLDLSRLKVERKVAQNDRAIAIVRIPTKAGGEVVLAEEWRVRDGKVVEIHIYFHDSASIPLSNRER